MDTTTNTSLTVISTVNAPVEKVWHFWSAPEHITKWNTPTEGWHTPRAENDLRTGGRFSSRMEARDGSMGFDFAGVYDEVKEFETIAYTMGDGRKAKITFRAEGDQTHITETFDPENINPLEMQQAGWQAILDNFARYTETTA